MIFPGLGLVNAHSRVLTIGHWGGPTAVDVFLRIGSLKVLLYLCLELMGGLSTALSAFSDEVIDKDGSISINQDVGLLARLLWAAAVSVGFLYRGISEGKMAHSQQHVCARSAPDPWT